MNLFVLHTPFQRYIAEHMIGTMSEFISAENRALIDDSGLGVNPDVWDSVSYVDPPVGMSFIGNGRRLRNVVRGVLAEIGDRPANVLISNPDYPLSNGLVGATRGSDRLRLVSFPEGVLNALPANIGIKKRLKNLVKACYGRVVGWPFHNLGSDNSGLAEAERIYALVSVGLDDYRSKVDHIPPPAAHLDGELTGDCLVCGQPLTDFMDHGRYEELTRRLLRAGQEVATARVLFKPHPREPEETCKLAEQMGAVVVRDPRIVEEVFDEIAPSSVVSFSSSALLHVKVLHGSRVRCIAAGAEEVMRSANGSRSFAKRLEDLYRQVGIEWVELPPKGT